MITKKAPKVKRGWFYIVGIHSANEKTRILDALEKVIKSKDIELMGTTPMIWTDRATLEKVFSELGVDLKHIQGA